MKGKSVQWAQRDQRLVQAGDAEDSEASKKRQVWPEFRDTLKVRLCEWVTLSWGTEGQRGRELRG